MRVILAAMLAVSTSLFGAIPGLAQPLTTVTVGVPNTTSDAPFFIGEKLGYFRQEGIDLKIISFRGAPEMMAPLSVGQLDVASGTPAASLYNAVAQGAEIRMVADKGTVAPGFGYGPLMVRKDLVTSGRYKSPRDLRGMRIAEASPGSVNGASLARLLKSVGIAYKDVRHVYIPFPEQAAAFANGAIDAAVTAEPAATVAERRGVAVRAESNDVWYPGQEQSVLMYGSAFTKKRDLAVRFMTAYIRSVRFFHDAAVNGHLRGPEGEQVIDVLAQYTPIKDRKLLAEMVVNAVDPNGRLNVASLTDDLNWLRSEGYVQSDVTVARAVDTSFQEEALRRLGPYKQRKVART